MMQSTYDDLDNVLSNAFPVTAWVIHLATTIDFNTVKFLDGYDHCYYQFHSKQVCLCGVFMNRRSASWILRASHVPLRRVLSCALRLEQPAHVTCVVYVTVLLNRTRRCRSHSVSGCSTV